MDSRAIWLCCFMSSAFRKKLEVLGYKLHQNIYNKECAAKAHENTYKRKKHICARNVIRNALIPFT